MGNSKNHGLIESSRASADAVPGQSGPAADVMERFHSLSAGEYWRALDDVDGVPSGRVLLIESIRWVDGVAHTVILRGHPSERSRTSRRFLAEEFVQFFEYEPDGEAIRGRELAEVQGRVEEIQRELMTTQGDERLLAARAEQEYGDQVERPERLAGLPVVYQRGQVELGVALQSGITEDEVGALKAIAQSEHRLATLKSKWITGKTKEISTAIAAMAPFYEEKAAVALARTEDVRTYVSDLHKALETLDLFVGKGVETETIREGVGADPSERLHVWQRKLYIDEELCLFCDLDEDFSAENLSCFVDTLQNQPAFIDQLIPSPRGVAVIATSRRFVRRETAMSTAEVNRANSEVFLLCRNGENIYAVYSPVTSHLGAHRLFPTDAEIEELYQAQGFHGLDCTNITFKDVAFTDSLEKHLAAQLHYKRFLILLAGLDLRESLFGEFYPLNDAPHFVSIDFQRKYLKFVRDDDPGRLLPDGRKEMPPIDKWIRAKNCFAGSGARVLCYFPTLVTPDTAPACCRENDSGLRNFGPEFYVDYKPGQDYGLHTIVRRGNDLCVLVDVTGWKLDGSEREFTAKIAVNRFGKWHGSNGEGLSHLVLDRVCLWEIEYYLSNREERRDQIFFVRILKRARDHLLAEMKDEAWARNFIAELVEEQAPGPIPDRATGPLVERIVQCWRGGRRGAALPATAESAPVGFGSSLRQLVRAMLNPPEGEELAKLALDLGRKPLQLAVDGRGELRLYTTKVETERDDRLAPDQFVMRFDVLGKVASPRLGESREVALKAHEPSEYVLHRWDDAEKYSDLSLIWPSTRDKGDFFEPISRSSQRLEQLTALTPTEFLATWFGRRESLTRSDKRFVITPHLAVPVGACLTGAEGSFRPAYICLAHRHLLSAYCRRYQDDELNASARELYVSRYADKMSARERFDEELESEGDEDSGFCLVDWDNMDESLLIRAKPRRYWPTTDELVSSLDGRPAFVDPETTRGASRLVQDAF